MPSRASRAEEQHARPGKRGRAQNARRAPTLKSATGSRSAILRYATSSLCAQGRWLRKGRTRGRTSQP
eukprot:8741439-Lingulodinium_polyedra.AAC.1